MSYILDALKKAEKQRELGQVPSIGSVQEAGSRGPGRRWRWALLVVLVLNAALITGVLFWAVQDREDMRTPADAVHMDPVARSPVGPAPTGPGPAPLPESEAASGSTLSAARPIADAHPLPQSGQRGAEAGPLKPLPLPAGTPPGSPGPAQVSAPDAATEPAGGASTARSIADTRSTPPSSENTGDGAGPLKPLPLPQEPPPASPPARSATGPTAPSAPLRGLPAAAPKRQTLPVWPLVDDDLFRQIDAELKVNVHVYSKNPEGRFVFMNMKIYREGDRLLEGPQLEEITQDGVVLSFRGERFRVPAR